MSQQRQQQQYSTTSIAALVVVACLVGVLYFHSSSSTADSKENNEDHKMPLVGGASDAREPDETTIEITNKMKPVLEAKTNKQYSVFKPVAVSTQVVAGTNFFIKVLVDESTKDHVHLRVWRQLDGTLDLSAYQESKTVDDPIGYFER